MNHSLLKTYLFATGAILLASVASTLSYAQQVYWSPGSGTLQQGKANRLQLHFEACVPDGSVDLPNVTNADFNRTGQTSSTNIFNSRIVQKMIIEGRRATWPKVERIRNTTQISRTFDDCLKRLSEQYEYVRR